MNKYQVNYLHCKNCGFLTTENPYWLKSILWSISELTQAYSEEYKYIEKIANSNTDFLMVTMTFVIMLEVMV